MADTTKPSGEHLKANGLGKIPAFVGEDGYALSECIAIAIYGMSLSFKTFAMPNPHGSVDALA